MLPKPVHVKAKDDATVCLWVYVHGAEGWYKRQRLLCKNDFLGDTEDFKANIMRLAGILNSIFEKNHVPTHEKPGEQDAQDDDNE